ncbi:uncharacterized protein DDB_G0271670-like [Chenopodium quinoa]|uniref:uncharacterized protein DDB_G0271670-like n=1 Tax=Chenopodium quinoa TaxID=63459 RepID=UPI000B77ED1D|nr:uncharacterized protein DDB_G0271670-like [Chenopodium quinoa]
MNVDHPKYLHSVKTKEAAAAATTATTTIGVASCKVGRRRRLISREASNLSNLSVEAGGGEYHAQEPAAVPFVWESSPGTPKRHVIMRSSNYDHQVDHLFPPLTPPPSYQYKGNKYSSTRIRPAFSSSKKKMKENDGNSNLIQSIFPRLSFTRDHSPTLSSSSSTKSSSRPSTSNSSSSSSSPSSQSRSVVSTPSPIHRQKLSFEYPSVEVEEEEEERVVGRSGSPVSTLCFSRLSCCNAKFRCLYSTWF